MAEALDLEKQAIRDLAAQHLGVSAKDLRVFTSDAVTRDQIAAILTLPVDGSDYVPLQNELTGEVYPLIGVDSWFGDTPLIPA